MSRFNFPLYTLILSDINSLYTVTFNGILCAVFFSDSELARAFQSTATDDTKVAVFNDADVLESLLDSLKNGHGDYAVDFGFLWNPISEDSPECQYLSRKEFLAGLDSWRRDSGRSDDADGIG
jgi:hypothetical protein